MNCIMGCIIPERNWDFQADFVQGLVGFIEPLDRFVLMVERLNDVVPAVDLLHLAVDVPQVFLLGFEKLLRTLTTMKLMHSIDMGRMHSAARVSSQLMVSIITSTPTTWVTEVMSWVMLWLRLWLRVSTSLVTRESTSPWVLVSKYFIGRRLIFREISRRRLYDTFGTRRSSESPVRPSAPS